MTLRIVHASKPKHPRRPDWPRIRRVVVSREQLLPMELRQAAERIITPPRKEK